MCHSASRTSTTEHEEAQKTCVRPGLGHRLHDTNLYAARLLSAPYVVYITRDVFP